MLGSTKDKRRAIDRARKFATRIGEGCTFEGNVRGGDHCTVKGTVIGECDLSGILRLESKGRWQGNIVADVVIIAGTVEGSVTARSKIELGHTARVIGNLNAPAIAIAEGGTVDGEITMAKAEKITRFTERREDKKGDEAT